MLVLMTGRHVLSGAMDFCTSAYTCMEFALSVIPCISLN